MKKRRNYPTSMGKVAEVVSRLGGYETGLLNALRDLQPLVILASFSLVIGTFAAPLSASAAGYAIGASMTFLTGFILLLGRKVFFAIHRRKLEPDLVLLMAYGSIGLGLVLLYFVPVEVARIVPSIRFYFGLANGAVFTVFGLSLSDWILAAGKQWQLKYPGHKFIRPLYAASAIGPLLTFGSFALILAVPSLSNDVTIFVIPTVGLGLVVGQILAMVYLEKRWGDRKPPS